MTQALLIAARAASSHMVTLVFLGGVAAVVAMGLAFGIDIGTWIILPVAGLLINLLAALTVHTTLRTQPMLYCFHVMLGFLVLLVLADRLTALKGHVEVTEGAFFNPALAQTEAGPLHPYALDEISFVQGGFEINYLPGMKRRETVSFLRVPGGSGEWIEATVGDDHPLVVGNYRFYTSFNKGFAPVITYTAPGGDSVTGAVHMPSYPLRDFDQGNEWTPPSGGEPVTLWLNIEEPVYDPNVAWKFRKPTDPILVVIEDDLRHELAIGQEVAMADGARVQFDALRVWMGYTIVANLFNTWMIAAAIAACVALAVHVWGKLIPARPAHAVAERGGT